MLLVRQLKKESTVLDLTDNDYTQEILGDNGEIMLSKKALGTES